jgi:4-diphosphocytidyl-2-C-methyl-D-erythritol kinase
VPDRVTVLAHAKINLLLRILAREPDGYHQIETAFTLLELADELTVSRTETREEVRIDVDGPDLGPPENNLAVRAARAVLDATGNRFGVRITLTKRIPARAGLGGGSSDGAAALHAVNLLADGAVPRHEILNLAGQLGSDVAFFASGAPLAIGWGRGQRLFRLPAPSSAPALVGVPAVDVSTADAYRWWDEQQAHAAPVRGPVVLDHEPFASWGSIGRLGGNDFETPVFGRHAEIRALYERLAGTRPLWVRLCGSGSAVAAVYRNERDRDDAALQLGEKTQELLKTQTRAIPPRPPEPVS